MKNILDTFRLAVLQKNFSSLDPVLERTLAAPLRYASARFHENHPYGVETWRSEAFWNRKSPRKILGTPRVFSFFFRESGVQSYFDKLFSRHTRASTASLYDSLVSFIPRADNAKRCPLVTAFRHARNGARIFIKTRPDGAKLVFESDAPAQKPVAAVDGTPSTDRELLLSPPPGRSSLCI